MRTVWVKDTFEMRVQCPPQLSRRYITALAYEKMMKEIEAKKWTPIPKTFALVWLDARYGVAICEAWREKPLTDAPSASDPQTP